MSTAAPFDVLTIWFDRPMVAVGSASLTATSGAAATASVTCTSPTGFSCTVQATETLREDTTYYVTIAAGAIKDVYGGSFVGVGDGTEDTSQSATTWAAVSVPESVTFRTTLVDTTAPALAFCKASNIVRNATHWKVDRDGLSLIAGYTLPEGIRNFAVQDPAGTGPKLSERLRVASSVRKLNVHKVAQRGHS